MKLAILSILLAVSPAVATAEPAPLQVTAKVLEMPKKLRYCGVIAFRAVVRYQVISVDKGAYTGKEIFVVELCPETLKAGQTRKLRLRLPTKNDSFADEFKATPGPRWINTHVES